MTLKNLTINGRRFEEAQDARIDHRHPIDADPMSADFACQKDIAPPTRYQLDNFVAACEADLLILESSEIRLHSIELRNSITIGVAIGPGCRAICLDQIAVSHAGQIGVWMGAALGRQPPRPLIGSDLERLPAQVRISDSTIESCGASGLAIEGTGIRVSRTIFQNNHCDFPFNENGGQIVIDYKASDVVLDECMLVGGGLVSRPVFVQSGWPHQEHQRIENFASVGIEASGSDLVFKNLVVRNSPREAIHIDGAHRVRIEGGNSSLENNHVAAAAGIYPWSEGPRHNISITTSEMQRALGCEAADIQIVDIRCEDGVLLWSDGSIRGLQIPRVSIVRSDLAGKHSEGLTVGLNAEGRSLLGL